MTNTLGKVLPWPSSQKQSRTTITTSETTSGGSVSFKLVVVAQNLNPGEAAIIKGRLESEGIPAFVQQEAMGAVLGLTVGPLGSAKVLVPAPLVERALNILSETFNDEETDNDLEGE